jgi:uncharacterized damage-inducible protein DinB
MTEWIRQAFADALYGKNAHYDVLKALQGITAEEARKQPIKNERSIWDHLYHIVFWHNVTLRAIQGKKIDWKAIQGTDWLPQNAKLTEKSWKDLVKSFSNHLSTLKKIGETEDLTRPIKGFGNMPLGRGIIIEFQHNGYHIGQIVILRKMLNLWPPLKEKEE